MPHETTLEQWEVDVSRHLGHLSRSMSYVLALYAFGMAVTRHSGQTVVTAMLSHLLKVKPNTVRQRLREITYEATAKRGKQRQVLEVASCFAPLLRWALNWFGARTARELVLAMDVTYLGERFTILAVSVLVSGCAIPVAWHIQRSSEKGAWQPIWLALFGSLQAAVPPGWTVKVLADGGLYSKALFLQLRDRCGWHPYMRIGTQGLCRTSNGKWQSLAGLARRGMTPTVDRLICFKGDPLCCTVLVEWAAEHDRPCLVVTDQSVNQVCHATYHYRFWIESGFKDLKRGGLHWEQTKMTCPQRVERLWLVMSLALLYLVALGAMTDPDLPGSCYLRPLKRKLSWMTQGWLTLLARLIRPASQPQPVLPLLFDDTYP